MASPVSARTTSPTSNLHPSSQDSNAPRTSFASHSTSTSSRAAPRSNLAPELLVWRRLQQGNLPQPLAAAAEEEETRRRDDGRTEGAWTGVMDSRQGARESKSEERSASQQTGRSVQRKTTTWVPENQKLPWRERIRHFTWTWFTMTMATGGIANVLWAEPLRFQALYAIGCIFFILNLVLFVFNVCMISARFYLYPETFKASFIHPTESLFTPAAVITLGTIFINISQYGVGTKTGPWMDTTMVILFWLYCILAVSFSSGIYLILWSTQTFTISQMTPIWIFPAYPLLIVGPHAAILASKISPERAMTVLVAGFTLQGIGFMVSLMIYAAYLYRLMTQKLPKESMRPGMFISVGPSGFTISALIGMGQVLPAVIPADFMGDGAFCARVTTILANWTGLWLWGLALWFFIVSVGAHSSVAAHGSLDFSMTWYSFVFPNTALTTATFAVARALDDNYAIEVLGAVMTCLLLVTWALVFGMMLRAVAVKQILWPQKQEDRDEGGFRQRQVERRNKAIVAVDPEKRASSNAKDAGTNASTDEGPGVSNLERRHMDVDDDDKNDSPASEIEVPPFTRPRTPEVEPATPPDMSGGILSPGAGLQSLELDRSLRSHTGVDR